MATRGRPPADQQTRPVRAYEDMADRLGWIARLTNTTVAEILDDIAGEEIDRRFSPLAERVKVIKAAEAGHDYDLGGEG